MRRGILIIGVVWLSLISARGAEVPPPGPATFQFWNREVVTFRATLAGLTPEERREATERRFRELPDFALYKPVTATPIRAGTLSGIALEIDGRRLFAIVDEDLDPTHNIGLQAAADDIVAKLEDLRRAWLDQRNSGVILRAVGLSVVATLVYLGVLFGLSRLGRRVRLFFLRRAGRLKTLRRRDFDLRPVILQLNRRLISLLFALSAFAATYLWITYLLGRFPYTAPWADVLGTRLATLGESLLSSILSALPGLLVAVLIFFLTRGTARIVDQLLSALEKSENEADVLGRDTARATRRIAGLVIWIAGIVIAYPYIPGSESPAFKGIGVLLGLMVSIGSSGFINQLMSGFVVLYSRAVRSGEFIRIGDIEGTVTDIGLLSTKLHTPRHEFISIPNAVLISQETRNFTRQHGDQLCELSTSVTIGYDAPWRQVHELLLDAADRTPGIRDQPSPFVLQTALSDFYVEYELRFVPGDVTRKGRILSELHQRIQDAFHDAGVQIMSPHFESQPDRPVLPAPRAS